MSCATHAFPLWSCFWRARPTPGGDHQQRGSVFDVHYHASQLALMCSSSSSNAKASYSIFTAYCVWQQIQHPTPITSYSSCMLAASCLPAACCTPSVHSHHQQVLLDWCSAAACALHKPADPRPSVYMRRQTHIRPLICNVHAAPHLDVRCNPTSTF